MQTVIAVETSSCRQPSQQIIDFIGHQIRPVDHVPMFPYLWQKKFSVSPHKGRAILFREEHSPRLDDQCSLHLEVAEVRCRGKFQPWEWTEHFKRSHMKSQELEDIAGIFKERFGIEIYVFEEPWHCFLELVVHALAQLPLDYRHDLVVLLQSQTDLAHLRYPATESSSLILGNRLQNSQCSLWVAERRLKAVNESYKLDNESHAWRGVANTVGQMSIGRFSETNEESYKDYPQVLKYSRKDHRSTETFEKRRILLWNPLFREFLNNIF